MTPVMKTESYIDALFISSKYTTLLFQITVSDCHPIKFWGLNEVVSKLAVKAVKEIHIVFIIPTWDASGGTFQGIQHIDSPQGADPDKVKRFENFPQYVCQLDFDAAEFHSQWGIKDLVGLFNSCYLMLMYYKWCDLHIPQSKAIQGKWQYVYVDSLEVNSWCQDSWLLKRWGVAALFLSLWWLLLLSQVTAILQRWRNEWVG